MIDQTFRRSNRQTVDRPCLQAGEPGGRITCKQHQVDKASLFRDWSNQPFYFQSFVGGSVISPGAGGLTWGSACYKMDANRMGEGPSNRLFRMFIVRYWCVSWFLCWWKYPLSPKSMCLCRPPAERPLTLDIIMLHNGSDDSPRQIKFTIHDNIFFNIYK